MRRVLAVLSLVACDARAIGDSAPAPVAAPPLAGPAIVDEWTAEKVRELPPASPDDGPARVRAEFVRALAKVEPRMHTTKVHELLGPPDDIKTVRDPGGLPALDTWQIWRYGTNGHLSFATLGTVHIKVNAEVRHVFGGAGTPADIDEGELRRVMRLLAAVPSYHGRGDPLRVIQAVNALHRLGKPGALAVLDEFLRVASPLDDPGREGVFLVIRALFDPPAGQALPPMRVGGPSPPPTDTTPLPRYPLALVDDIPLVLTRGFMLGGVPEAPEDHLRWYRVHAQLRAAPLRPPDDPLAAIGRAFAPGAPLAAAANVDSDDGRAAIYDQGLLLLDTVNRPRGAVDGAPRFAHGPDVAARWSAMSAAVQRLGATWDATRDMYVLPGGEVLAPSPPPLRPGAFVTMPLVAGGTVRVAARWAGSQSVDIEVRTALAAGVSAPAAVVIVSPEEGTEHLAELSVAPQAATAEAPTSSVITRHIAVKIPARLRVVLIVGDTAIGDGLLDP